jgi:hypothetical protein
MKRFILITAMATLFTGCANRYATDVVAAGAVGGGTYLLTKDKTYGAVGAGVGIVASELGQVGSHKAEQKAFKAGYNYGDSTADQSLVTAYSALHSLPQAHQQELVQIPLRHPETNDNGQVVKESTEYLPVVKQ